MREDPVRTYEWLDRAQLVLFIAFVVVPLILFGLVAILLGWVEFKW